MFQIILGEFYFRTKLQLLIGHFIVKRLKWCTDVKANYDLLKVKCKLSLYILQNKVNLQNKLNFECVLK